MNEIGFFASRTRVAYLCMEIALRPEIHTYSGGLGILAGDTVRSCSDLGLPVVFVTLMSRAGCFRQEIGPDGGQQEHPDNWDPAAFARPLPAMVGVDIEDRTVWIRPWSAHEAAKADLCYAVAERVGKNLDPARPIIGFARRMTGYKRPTLLFSDLARLSAIAARHPFQVVVAGKAHPRDAGGKELIKAVLRDRGLPALTRRRGLAR